MEEDNDEITGWDDNDIKILDFKAIKKQKKKMTQSTVTDDQAVERKMKASQTLPFIKNKPSSLDSPPLQPLEKKQPAHLDKLHRTLQERITKAGKSAILKEYLGSLDSIHASQTTPKQQQKILFEQKEHKENESEQNSSFHKKSGQVKHGSTIVKAEKISENEKLKILANEYISSTKNTPRSKVEKTDMLKKITKGSLGNLNKKQKNKYFVVQKQRLSPEKLSQEVSKMAIELKKPSDEDTKLSPIKQKSGYFIKQKYKDLIKPIQMQKEKKNNPVLVKSQSQQFKNNTHARRNTNFDGGRSTHKNQSKISACRDSTFHQCIGSKQQDATLKKLSKWDQVLKEVQNQAKTLKKLKDNQKKIFKAAKQSSTGLLPNFNQKALMLEMMVTKRLRKDIMNAQSKMISNLKKTITKEQGQGENYLMKKERTMMTEGSTCYDEFNDECLFYNKPNKQDSENAKLN